MDRGLSVLLMWIPLLAIPLMIWAAYNAWPVVKKKIMIAGISILAVGVLAVLDIYGTMTNPHRSAVIMGAIAGCVLAAVILCAAYFLWPADRNFRTVARVHPSGKKGQYFTALLTGNCGDVSLIFKNMLFVQKMDKTRSFVEPEFDAWMLEEIQRKAFARKEGGFEEKMLCPSCGCELRGNDARPGQIDCSLKYQDYKPISLCITAPTVVCPQCNKRCLVDNNGRLKMDLSEAMANAMRSEKINP